MLALEHFLNGWPRKFLESVQVMTKYTEKTHVDLWEQSTILNKQFLIKQVWDVQGYVTALYGILLMLFSCSMRYLMSW
jgi:hypothetical protein